ncbi:MAG: PAS domain-containing protein [Hyalangium sp.]|uniref:sensor histidine kinase n=1 Tax=Hyalangium sp. TaxID=2028555 RepID=UPI003899A189
MSLSSSQVISVEDVIASQRDVILEHWMERIHRALQPDAPPRAELLDHIPRFLDSLILAMRLAHSPAQESAACWAAQAALKHGELRLREGFSLDTVVYEYGVLRDCLLTLAREQGLKFLPDQMRAFTECFHRGIAEAAIVYLQQHERELRAAGAAAERQHAHALLAAILDKTTDLVGALDTDFRFILFNRRYQQEFETRFGTRISLGMSLPDALAHLPEQKHRLVALWGRALRGEEFTVVQPFGDPAQEDTWYELRYARLEDAQGEIQGAFHVGRDVTAARKAHEELDLHVQERTAALAQANARLRESEERFRATFNQAAVGIAHVGLDERWLQLNQCYLELLGSTEPELRKLTVRDVTHLEDREKSQSLMRQLLAGELAHYTVEQRYQRRNGEPVWVELTVSLVRDASGAPSYFIFAAVDISENVRLYQEAQRAVHLRDEFLQVASHELKTPLTPLSLKLQMLSRVAQAELSSITARRLQRDVEVMHRQVNRLAELMDDLLDVSRITAGQLHLNPESVDLCVLTREVSARFTPQATRAGCRLQVELGCEALGQWDPLRLEQVVSNLLSNAIKYGAGRPIHIRAETAGNRARLTVRDEGIGIAPEALGRIFHKFERAVSERNYGGLGLGLFITRQIVEASGGSIQVESQLGRGATFIVELPLARPVDTVSHAAG